MNTKEMVEVMQSYHNGKQIQCRNIRDDIGWIDTSNPIWNWYAFEYRTKPKNNKDHWFVGCPVINHRGKRFYAGKNKTYVYGHTGWTTQDTIESSDIRLPTYNESPIGVWLAPTEDYSLPDDIPVGEHLLIWKLNTLTSDAIYTYIKKDEKLYGVEKWMILE